MNYVRGRTWISASFVQDRLESLAGKPVSNCESNNVLLPAYYCPNRRASDSFTDEDKKKFENDDYYRNFRWELESELNVIALVR